MLRIRQLNARLITSSLCTFALNMVKKMFKISFVLLLIAIGVCWVSGEPVFRQVDREIDAKSAQLKITSRIKLENSGSAPLTSFYFPIHASNEPFFAYFDVQQNSQKLKTNDVSGEKSFQNAPIVFEVLLKEPLASGQVISLIANEVYMNKIRPYPVEIYQKENQLVKFSENVHMYSPYRIGQESTAVSTGTSSVENFSKITDFTRNTNTVINYGMFKNVEPFSYREIYVHYENHSPFLLIRNLERIIEVTHWGSISVEEHVEMVHSGARLRGPFSRYDFMMGGRSDGHWVKSFTTILPKGAHDIYYRDMNGNISTSNIRTKKNFLEIELQPRFPLFGGWKTKYILGYTLPSGRYLHYVNNQYQLKLPFVDHIHFDMQIEKMKLSIRMPLGAKNFAIKTPYESHRLPDTLYHNYLDSFGRTVLNFEKTKVVENHIQSIEIAYSRNQLFSFYEPCIVVVYLGIIVKVIALIMKFDFSLKKKSSTAATVTTPISAASTKKLK